MPKSWCLNTPLKTTGPSWRNLIPEAGEPSAVKSTVCSSMGPGLSAQHSWSSSRPRVTPDPGSLIPSFGLHGHQAHTCYIYIYTYIYIYQYTHTRTYIKWILKVFKSPFQDCIWENTDWAGDVPLCQEVWTYSKHVTRMWQNDGRSAWRGRGPHCSLEMKKKLQCPLTLSTWQEGSTMRLLETVRQGLELPDAVSKWPVPLDTS